MASQQPHFCGVPVVWVGKLENPPAEGPYWFKHPSKMTQEELLMLARLLGVFLQKC